MRVYRVTYTSQHHGSHGYSWHSSGHAASRKARDFILGNREERTANVEALEVKATKAGILAALQCYATHPDNG